MADSGSLPSPAEKYKKPTSSFFSSPRLFTNFTSKGFNETDAVMSPTSILDSKPFCGFRNPFWSETNSPRTPGAELKRHWDKLDSKGVGLGLVDALVDDKPGDAASKKPETRMVLFGSQLKIQIPLLPPPSQALFLSESPKSPADFGIKTRNSQLNSSSGSFSPSHVSKPAFGSENSALETLNSPKVFTGCLSACEMELSEDYTRVISHGPNPRTTHIFDNCVIESSCFESFDAGFSSASSPKENGFVSDHTSYPSESFLSCCFYCKRSLGQGKDIYMYRGERAFCSRECRYQGMLLEEGVENLEADDIYGTC
ncbi:hypothetical protein L6164_025691 [Bauhinia variegata]|uniref:Uncharacterized protein n=1 Tax=Bauhinia variegata TaxID=167791 RepID=A0ACB9M1G9_BAUVA|nr:hypothetical protein L6164_025691 [Bauhinia variegata]